jgi:histidyl-tRNA synthetase
MQFDADTVGAPSVAADAEMCMLAADTMEALGIPRGSYVVKVNNRKVLDGVMEAIGIGGEENAGRRLTVLRAIDKLDRLGVEGVELLLGAGRKDESGDFTKGAGLDDEQIELVKSLWKPIEIPGFEFGSFRGSGTFALGRADDAGYSRDMEQTGPFTYIDNMRTLEAWELCFASCPGSLLGIQEMKDIVSICQAAGFGSKRFRVDSSVVRGLEYYTGPVFETELTFEAVDQSGRLVRFGSVGGGGRYDGLVGRFRSEPVPATGFSIGVSRLQAALMHLGKLDRNGEPGPVVVTVFDQDRIADYQKMVSALRNANIRAELYLGGGKFGAQMKYADKRGSPCVVIQGGNEKEKGEVQIKDLILGATLTQTKDRDEYLKKQAEAQFAVAEDKLVDEVRRVLARHDVRWD